MYQKSIYALDSNKIEKTTDGIASQAMLGDMMFAIALEGRENEVREAMEKVGGVLEYRVSSCGPKLIDV